MLVPEGGRAFQRHRAAAIDVGGFDLGLGEAERRQHVEAGIVHLLGAETERRLAVFLAQRPFVEGEADIEGGRERGLERRQRARGEALGAQLLVAQRRRVLERGVADGIARDRLDVARPVAEGPERLGHGAVDDAEIAAARELLELDDGEIGLDAGGVAIHHEAGSAGRRDHGRLRVAVAVALAQREGDVPGVPSRVDERRLGAVRGVERHRPDGELFVSRGLAMRGAAVVADHPQHRLAILLEAGEGAELARHLGRGRISDAGHDRGQGAAQGAAFVAVVRQPRAHQQPAEIGDSPGRGCGTRRRAARSRATGTAPSAPRFRA